MGDHPLRPPTRRSLGGPLPRQLANGTRGHPLAMNIWNSPHAGRFLIRCQTRFHRLVPGPGAGSSRVTHPFATLLAIANFLVRLACLIHAASVHSEPGSNSPLLKSLTAPLGALSFLGSCSFTQRTRGRDSANRGFTPYSSFSHCIVLLNFQGASPSRMELTSQFSRNDERIT